VNDKIGLRDFPLAPEPLVQMRFSQLLGAHKDREVWFSLKENPEKAYGSGLHQMRKSFSPAEWGLPSTNEDFCGLDYKPVIRGNVSP
jgi:hypothetical protein